ncbi:MAG: mercuric transporter [Alphaproteobacteria bacterium]|nr:MAG: mercuric transporter [Alphaproteobacteria bacterium]
MVRQPTASGTAPSWFAAGGVAGAVLASSCCILPLALVTLGVSGAWIGNLRVLEPYKPLFIAGAAIFIALGFWQAYFRPRAKCEDGSYCARPQAALITQVTLWLAAALVTLAATVDWWAPLFY